MRKKRVLVKVIWKVKGALYVKNLTAAMAANVDRDGASGTG